MGKYWVEYRANTKRRGPPKFVPLDMINAYTGFRSITAFPEELMKKLELARSTKGLLKHEDVYADTLFVDFDNTDSSSFEQGLRNEGLSFEKYDSGNRSIHFHIPIVPVLSDWIAMAMKSWMRKKAPNADLSFYHPGGMYRLPLTMHYKTSRCKTLLERYEGKQLVLSKPTFHIKKAISVMEGSTDQKKSDLIMMFTGNVYEGGRSPKLWLMATLAKEVGWDFDYTLEKLLVYNEKRVIPPHLPDKVESQCKAAYDS